MLSHGKPEPHPAVSEQCLSVSRDVPDDSRLPKYLLTATECSAGTLINNGGSVSCIR